MEEVKLDTPENMDVTINQVTQHVSSKDDLLYALKIKGKSQWIIWWQIWAGQIYLPEERHCTLEFLRAILNGQKSYYVTKDVKLVSVPRYSEITVKQVINFIFDKPHILKYIPNLKKSSDKSMDREFLFNIVNTVEPEYFPELVRQVEAERM